jgi:2-methylcitrate dehydratase PrpD
VASALLGGGGLGVFHEDFTDAAVADPARLALAGKVECAADAQCTAAFPRQFGAVLTARLGDGSAMTERVTSSRGGPGNPLSEQELTTKFLLNAGRSVPGDTAGRLAGLIGDLRAGRHVADVTALLRTVT